MTRKMWLGAALTAGLVGCAALQQFSALRQVVFTLGRIGTGRLAGVSLTRIASYSTLSATEVARITIAVARKDLPLDFVLDVHADNPIENKVAATMVRLAWSLYLDDKQTISGVVDTSITIPSGGQVVIPMRMRLNLMEFFDGPAEDLVNIAAAVAGLNTDPTRVSLRAVPTINTPIGPIAYPTPITIVTRTVGGP